MDVLSVFLVIFTYIIKPINGLSGHVCTRERAENYLTSYNQAFLCQERYTTSCGHLDWRRCTRYRVQTCFTPKQRYQIRYHEVEVCCSGWREDGAGQCTVPVCPRECQNGGTCSAVGNMPGCLCQEGYSGDTCQHARNTWNLWQTVILCGAFLTTILIISVIVITLYYKRYRGYNRLSQEDVSINLPAGTSSYPSTHTQLVQHETPGDDYTYHSASLRRQLTANNVNPSAPPLYHLSPNSNR